MEHRINFDESIWEKVKSEAERRDLSTDEIVKQALETFLDAGTKKVIDNSLKDFIFILIFLIVK